MASSINASTIGVGGVVTSADNSGVLDLQSGGTTVATISSSGFSLPTGKTMNLPNTFGFKNRIINGDFRIWQRGTSFSNVGNQYTADRWGSSINTINMSVSQSTDVPNVQYKYSLLFAPAANGTPSEYVLRQWIEQQNIFDLAGQTVTVSLWAKCSKSTFNVRCCAYNATGGQDQTTTFTVTPGVWTKVTASYTSFSTVTAWTSTPNNAGAFLDIGYVNSTALTTSDYLYFTGVQLEVGSQATSFDFRDYGRELIMCQRYCLALGDGVTGVGRSTTQFLFTAYWTQIMRTAPAVTITDNSISLSDNYVQDFTSSGSTADLVQVSAYGGRISISGYTGLTQGRWYGAFNNTNGYFLLLTAEL